tara:strand:- start:874 stop:1737 length:864 start_codon:yes stop_codon:yes gene_type:complete
VFWEGHGVPHQLLEEKTEQFRTILNDRGTGQKELPEDVGDEIIAWFNHELRKKSPDVKPNDHIDKLFPTEAEIIKMLDDNNIGKEPKKVGVKYVDISEINPFLAIKGGKRRKRRRKTRKTSVPKRYVPKQLSKKDKKKQGSELKKSRQAYKKGKYHTRKKVKSFKSKVSPHIIKARKMYKVDKITPNKKLAKACGCKIQGLRKIVKKGQGAYFSSGSRPNQTGHSWGYARMASSITGGKASAVDYNILEKYCTKKSKALKLAKKMRGKGTRRVKQVKIGGRRKTRKY